MQACSCLFLILFFLLFSPQLNAEVLISDPDRVLTKLPVYVQPIFSKTFTCNQPHDFFMQVGKCQLVCNEAICKEICSSDHIAPVRLQAEECMDDSVQIYNSQGQAYTVLKTDYELAQNSMISSVLKQMENFYEPIKHIKIIRSTFVSGGKLIENGKMILVPTTQIEFEAFPEDLAPGSLSEASKTFYLEVDLKRKGLNQLMFLDTDRFHKNGYLFKRKGFINAAF